MSSTAKDVLETRCTAIYELTPEDEKAVREGLADLERGEWTSDDAMRAFWVRCGVV